MNMNVDMDVDVYIRSFCKITKASSFQINKKRYKSASIFESKSKLLEHYTKVF